MERMALLLGVCLLLAGMPAAVFAEGKRPLKIEDMFTLKRVGDPHISPDGKWVVYSVTSVSLAENKSTTSLWLAPTDGGKPRQLTNSPKRDGHPRWSPDGKQILFGSNRGGSGQLWVISLEGGEARQLTSLSTGASNGMWSPDGKTIAFLSDVYPEYSHKPFKESDALNRKRAEEIEKSPVKAKVFKSLFYRHWDSYVEDKRQHLFVMSADGGEPRDVTPGNYDANPTSGTFSIGDDFTFSPDGSHLLFTSPPDKNEAWSTDYRICRVPVTGGKVEVLTTDNPAADSAPRFSPDGKRLTWRAQKRAGYEADRWQLMLMDSDPSGKPSGKPRSLTDPLDRAVDEYIWVNNETLVFGSDDNGSHSLFLIQLVKGGPKISQLKIPGSNGSLSASDRSGSPILAFASSALDRPSEIMVATGLTSGDIEIRNISEANREALAQLDLPRPESVQIPVEGGKMQMWILKPPGFDPDRKWPLVYLVHGGPQGAWGDGWSWRWNPEIWAAQGYVIALPNPRGSTGFGQKFVDEISGDWGGKCYDDLMAGMDYLEKLPYIDTKRMASAGASFGGYMMNWFQGKTDRFKTLITHCGVYNFDSMYATTDELWFDEWEHGGPPWGPNRESYEKHSPHRLAKNFKTPMLIIHNDLDFRVPISEGIQLFTTLQRLGVPSKLINFPDEGHWVLKPANSAYWHREVFAWLAKYVPPGPR